MSTLAHKVPGHGDVDVLRMRLGAVLNRMSDQMVQLGQLAAGLAHIDAEALPACGATYGSTITVKNIDTGTIHVFTLMAGALVDVAENHVSLASPIGQALLGRSVGEEVEVNTPQGIVRYRIIRLATLEDLLRALERKR